VILWIAGFNQGYQTELTRHQGKALTKIIPNYAAQPELFAKNPVIPE
jgi:hypothetical protein